MKKTLFITEFYSPTVGGAVTVYDNIYGLYPPATVWVLTQRTAGVPDVEARDGVSVRRLSFPLYYHSKLRMLLEYARCFFTAWGLIRKHGIEEIHCDQVVPAGMLGWMLHRTVKIPYYLYAHGEEISIGARFPFRRKWMRRIYGESRGIFANSRYTASLLEEVGVAKGKAEVIYWGVRRDSLGFWADQALLRKKFGVEGKKVFLTVARLIRRKGHALALKALRDLPAAGMPDWHYLVVGEGEEQEYLRLLVRDYGLGKKVSFLGRLGDKELLEAYSVCDVFVMPNFMLENGEVEGFGLVFLEAGARKKPAIGGKSGGTPEAVLDGVTGYVVEPGRSEELGRRMRELAADPSLATKMGEASFERIESFFVWEKVLERMRQFQKKREEA